MQTLGQFRALSALDARTVARDDLLRALIALPPLIALAVRLGLPAVLDRLGVIAGVRLSELYAPLAGYILVVIGPVLCGAVAGFMLLDQRDDGTLAALRVTPLSPVGFLAYRLAGPLLLSAVLAPLGLVVAGLPLPGLAALLAVTLLAAPLGPLFALLLAGFAQDKIQGLALMKAANVLVIAPLAAFFLPPSAAWVFGLLPAYWPARLWWGLAAGDPSAWLALPLGLACHAIVLALLLRRYLTVIYR